MPIFVLCCGRNGQRTVVTVYQTIKLSRPFLVRPSVKLPPDRFTTGGAGPAGVSSSVLWSAGSSGAAPGEPDCQLGPRTGDLPAGHLWGAVAGPPRPLRQLRSSWHLSWSPVPRRHLPWRPFQVRRLRTPLCRPDLCSAVHNSFLESLITSIFRGHVWRCGFHQGESGDCMFPLVSCCSEFRTSYDSVCEGFHYVLVRYIAAYLKRDGRCMVQADPAAGDGAQQMVHCRGARCDAHPRD